jgi:hypothetical protein
MATQSGVVLMGRVVRVHGVPKEGFQTLKVQLSNPGGTVFQELKSVYFSKSEFKSQPKVGVYALEEFTKLELLRPVRPLGGKWGETPAVLISVPDSKELPYGVSSWVGVDRDLLPKLDSGFYLVDLLGTELFEGAAAQPLARIVGFFETGSGGAVKNLGVRAELVEGGHVFEFPAQSIVHFDQDAKKALVENLGEWLALSLTRDGEGGPGDSNKRSFK